MRRTKLVVAIVVAFVLVYVVRAPRTSDAVTISPTAIYLSSRDRAGSFELYNGEDQPVEVNLSLAFGYPTSDSLGRVDVQLIDSVPPGEPSAVGWLRLYPRRILLQPKQRQVVRVGAYPPTVLPNGEYWARLLVRSRVSALPVDVDNAQGGGRARQPHMKIETLFITALNYRNGSITTGVRVDNATVHASDSTPSLTLDLTRTGNAAFLGRIAIEVLSTRGDVVAQAREDVAVYRSLRRVYTLAVPRGTGAVFRYRLSTEREDLDPALIAHAEPVTGQVRFAP